jgi:N-acetyl-anhydromuramyl-L-alanine amidase AmpD
MTIEISSKQSLVTRLDNARYHGAKRSLDDVWYLIGHATGGSHPFAVSQEWQNRDLDPEGKKGPKGKTSYHYGIDRDGSITRALPTNIIAYSNGDSGWPAVAWSQGGNRSSLNPRAIGIAWANDDAGEELTPEQLESGLWLFTTLMHQIHAGPSRVLGHYEISPGRKPDPRKAISMREFRQQLAEVRLV